MISSYEAIFYNIRVRVIWASSAILRSLWILKTSSTQTHNNLSAHLYTRDLISSFKKRLVNLFVGEKMLVEGWALNENKKMLYQEKNMKTNNFI